MDFSWINYCAVMLTTITLCTAVLAPMIAADAFAPHPQVTAPHCGAARLVKALKPSLFWPRGQYTSFVIVAALQCDCGKHNCAPTYLIKYMIAYFHLYKRFKKKSMPLNFFMIIF